MQIYRWPLAMVPLAVLLALGAPPAARAQLPLADTMVVLSPAQSPQPLSQALADLARQARLTLVASPTLLAGKRAPTVSGRFTPQQALDRLLAGSGLAGRIEAGALTVRALPPPEPATPASSAPDSGVELSTVLVTAEREMERPHAATVNTVTREELDRLPPTSTSDIFKGIPGVTAANARNGASFDLNVRGQQGDRIKVLVDGTQSTTNTSKSYGGENNHNYVDPDLVSSIVVEKGPNTGPHGAGTGGAVVNLGTLTADDLLRDGKAWGLRARGGWADNSGSGKGYMNYQGTAPLDVSTPGQNLSGSVAGAWRALDGKLDLVAAHSQRRNGNYHAGKRGATTYTSTGPAGEQLYPLSLYQPGNEVFNTSQDTRSTLLKARLQLPADQWVELSHNELDTRFGESRVTAYNYNIEQKQLSEVKKTTLLARYGWQPSDRPFWNLRANLWQSDLDELHPEITYGATGTSTTRGVEAWNTSVFDLRGVALTLAYGGTFQAEKTTGQGITEPRGKRELNSLFVRADAQLTQRLALEAGLRREAYTTDGTGSFVSPVPGQSRIPYTVTDGHDRVNPTIGVTFKPLESTELYARYSEGWRPPTAKEVGLSYGYQRKVLQPETTESHEVGVRWNGRDVWRARDTLSLSLAVFDNRHTNYLARTLDPTGNTPYYYFNIDGARFRGLELNARYDSGGFFATYGLNRYNSARFCGFLGPECTDSFVSDFGLVLFGVVLPPRHTQTLTLGTRLLERRLTLGLRAHFVSGPAGQVQASNGQSMNLGWKPYEVYDLFGSWQIHRNFGLNFAIENLRDRYHIEALSSPSTAIPSPGRTAKVTLTYQF